MKNISYYLLLITTLVFSLPAIGASKAKHIPGVFVGYTHVKDETLFTYGFEYEYKFTQQWGAGLVYEKINDAHHHDGVTVKVAGVYYHPTPNLRFGAGIGEEKIGGAHPHSENLYRLSVSYDYHIADFGIAPSLAVDFIDDEKAYVFGIAIVRPF